MNSVKINKGLVIERVIEKFTAVEIINDDGNGGQSITTKLTWNRQTNADASSPQFNESATFYAQNAKIGPYLIGKQSLQNLNQWQNYSFSDSELDNIKAEVKNTFEGCQNVILQGDKIIVR